jgi:hypothetical protein
MQQASGFVFALHSIKEMTQQLSRGGGLVGFVWRGSNYLIQNLKILTYSELRMILI